MFKMIHQFISIWLVFRPLTLLFSCYCHFLQVPARQR
jgi:hypothetical protein